MNLTTSVPLGVSAKEEYAELVTPTHKRVCLEMEIIYNAEAKVNLNTLPGALLSALLEAQSCNTVFMSDERLSMDIPKEEEVSYVQARVVSASEFDSNTGKVVRSLT